MLSSPEKLAANSACLLLSDVHLGPVARPDIARSLCELVTAHPEREWIFLGDTFEFSAVVDPDPLRAWTAIKAANPEVVTALSEHVARGGRLTFLAGNHDAALSSLADHFATTFGVLGTVEVVPWFTRRGAVHLEHGHLWDRDNAPLHPLADWSHLTEPLGVALMRRFCAACNAAEFAHAHQTTPAGGLARAFRLFGARAVVLVVRYFITALALCVEALLFRPAQLARARRQGSERARDLAERFALEPARVEAVLARAPEPTHRRFRSLFMRLYFDRVLTALGCAGLLAWSVASGPGLAQVGALVLGTSYLLWGGRRGVARYPGPVEALRQGGQGTAQQLGAQTVVFGHTHVQQRDASYVNLGSFAYCHGPGRPYATIDEDRVSSHYWPKSANEG